MFNFFKSLPKEVVSRIFNLNSRKEQARLARVDVNCNQLITNTNSLQLFKFKSEVIKYSVGDVLLIIKREFEDYKQIANMPYTLFTVKNGKKVFNSNMSITQKTFDEITEAINRGALPLIRKLMKGETGYTNARILDEEFKKQIVLNGEAVSESDEELRESDSEFMTLHLDCIHHSRNTLNLSKRAKGRML